MRTTLHPIAKKIGNLQVIHLERVDTESYEPVQMRQRLQWFVVTTSLYGKSYVSKRGTLQANRLDQLMAKNEQRLAQDAEQVLEHRVICAYQRKDVVQIFGDSPSIQDVLQNKERAIKHSEYFFTAEGTYDVAQALFLLESRERRTQTVIVRDLAESCGFTRPPTQDEWLLRFQYPHADYKVVIDSRHVSTELDLEKPLLVLSNGRVIDGNHRLLRAWVLGVKTLPVYILTEAEEKACIS